MAVFFYYRCPYQCPTGGYLKRFEDETVLDWFNDLLAAFDEAVQVTGMLGVANSRAHLGELLDDRFNLLVEETPVGDDDDRIKHFLAVPARADQLVSQPGDGAGLAAAGRVLDQVTLVRAVVPALVAGV